MAVADRRRPPIASEIKPMPWIARAGSVARTVIVAWAVAAACAAPAAALTLAPVATGLNQPVTITHASDSRLFVVEKPGRIRILRTDGTVEPTPFLDISGLVSTGSEQGLLGLAFHPQYASNGKFYVDYTDTSGTTVVAGYHVSANPDIADAASAQTVLTVAQPFANHNGGDITFGPDGYLYVGLGDGAAAATQTIAHRIRPCCSASCCGSTSTPPRRTRFRRATHSRRA
jgi:glucose/arabinose dehydrogenase